MIILRNYDVYRMMGNSINSELGSPGRVLMERTVDQRCKLIISDIPIYPDGKLGYLVLCFPQNFVKICENNDIECRELLPQEIQLFNGINQDSTDALIHTNIFDSGHPCLGSGASAVRIKDFYDLAAYTVASVLRINMTGQSFLSPTTRKYGATPEEMEGFKKKVQKMLGKHFGSSVMDLDYSQIYDDIRESFNDQYRIYIR